LVYLFISSKKAKKSTWLIDNPSTFVI
jgi:hypothetical protein